VLLTQVAYDADGFCERNRDVLFRDLIELMQTSNKLVSFCAAAAAFFALFAFIPSFSRFGRSANFRYHFYYYFS